jgi:hypothetical protein
MPCDASYTGSVGRRIVGQQDSKKKKIIKAKWTGRMAEVVECLPSKCKALSSNPA